MQKTVGFALVMVSLFATAPIASAQVVIQGEVTTTTTTSGSPQQQQQPPPYGYQQQQPVGYGVQSVYVQEPGAQSPQPMRYIHHSDPIGGLVAGGVIGLGAGFVFTLISELVLAGGYSSSGCSGYGCPDDTWYALTWIPIIGPWLGLGVGRGGDYEWVNYVGGILEDAGLVLLILGLVIHDEWDEPMYAFGEGRDAPAIWLRGNGLALTF